MSEVYAPGGSHHSVFLWGFRGLVNDKLSLLIQNKLMISGSTLNTHYSSKTKSDFLLSAGKNIELLTGYTIDPIKVI